MLGIGVRRSQCLHVTLRAAAPCLPVRICAPFSALSAAVDTSSASHSTGSAAHAAGASARLRQLSIQMYHGDGMNTEEFARVWREYQSHGYVMDVDVLGPVLSFYHNAGLHFSAIRLFQAFPALQWEPWMYNVIARCAFITRNTRLLQDIMNRAPLTEASARLFLEIQLLLHMHHREYLQASQVFSQIEKLSGTMTDWGIGNLINGMLRDDRSFPAVKYLDALAVRKTEAGPQGPGFEKFLRYCVYTLADQGVQLKDSRIMLRCLRMMRANNVSISDALLRSSARLSRFMPDPDLALEVFDIIKEDPQRTLYPELLLPGACAADDYKVVHTLLSSAANFKALLVPATLKELGEFMCRLANTTMAKPEEQPLNATQPLFTRPASQTAAIGEIRTTLQLFSDIPQCDELLLLATGTAMAEYGRATDVIELVDRVTKNETLADAAFEAMMKACAAIAKPQLHLGQAVFDRLRESQRNATDAFLNDYLTLLCRSGKGKRAVKLVKALLAEGTSPPNRGTECVARWALREIDRAAATELVEELLNSGFRFTLPFQRVAAAEFPQFTKMCDAVRRGAGHQSLAGDSEGPGGWNAGEGEEEEDEESLVAETLEFEEEAGVAEAGYYDTESEDSEVDENDIGIVGDIPETDSEGDGDGSIEATGVKPPASPLE